MHRVVRNRKLNGKSIPTDEESMKNILQTDSPYVITNQEKKHMRRALFRKYSV